MLLEHRAFATHLYQLVRAAMPIKGCCFYRVKEGRLITEEQLFDLSPYWNERYFQHFWRIDPQHPINTPPGSANLRMLDRMTASRTLNAMEYFQRFLEPQKTEFQADIYFHVNSRTVAGASLFKSSKDGAFTSDNLQFLERFVDFIDCSSEQEPAESGPSLDLALTPREREVACLIGEAARNKDISRRLDIELPTVKKHVTRVMRKMGVRSRAELVRKLRG